MRTPDEQLKLLMADALSETQEFRPCAYFDDRLDCIRVVTADCSILEERINERITVLLDSYYLEPTRRKYVGFTIKGARHFCKQHHLSLSTLNILQVLDVLVASSPDLVVEWFVKIVAKPLVEEGDLNQVFVPDRLLALA